MYRWPSLSLSFRIWMGLPNLTSVVTFYHSSRWRNLNGSVQSHTAREAENLNEPMQYYTVCHHKFGQLQTWLTPVLGTLEKIFLQFWNAQCILNIFNQQYVLMKSHPYGHSMNCHFEELPLWWKDTKPIMTCVMAPYWNTLATKSRLFGLTI